MSHVHSESCPLKQCLRFLSIVSGFEISAATFQRFYGEARPEFRFLRADLVRGLDHNDAQGLAGWFPGNRGITPNPGSQELESVIGADAEPGPNPTTNLGT